MSTRTMVAAVAAGCLFLAACQQQETDSPDDADAPQAESTNGPADAADDGGDGDSMDEYGCQ